MHKKGWRGQARARARIHTHTHTHSLQKTTPNIIQNKRKNKLQKKKFYSFLLFLLTGILAIL